MGYMKNKEKNEDSGYECPICHKGMAIGDGDGVDVNNGYSLYCPHKDCPAQECFGHAKNIRDAYEIVLDKYKKP